MPVPNTTYNLTVNDKQEIVRSAQRLGVQPAELSAVMLQESGIRPNQWELKGGDHFGVIQFGGPERRAVGMDPSRVARGDYTVAEQMPYVEKFLTMRGYKPGMGIKKLYTTILAGNPGASPDAADSNDTSTNKVYKQFQPGGQLYTNASSILGDIPNTTPYDQTTFRVAKAEQVKFDNNQIKIKAQEDYANLGKKYQENANNDPKDLVTENKKLSIKARFAEAEADLAMDEADRLIRRAKDRAAAIDATSEPFGPEKQQGFNFSKSVKPNPSIDSTKFEDPGSDTEIKNLAGQATGARRARQQELQRRTRGDSSFAAKAFALLGLGSS